MVLIEMTEYITARVIERYAPTLLCFGSFASVLNKAGAIRWCYKGENSQLSRHLLLKIISLKWLCAVRTRTPQECTLSLSLFYTVNSIFPTYV